MLKSDHLLKLDKDNRQYLAWELNKLCEFLDATYNVNCGGCCYVSYLIAKKLEELGVKYKVIFFDEELEDIKAKDIKDAIKTKNLNHIGCGDFTCNHYAIVIDDQIVNGGAYEGEANLKVAITSKELQWIYKTGDWNDTYNIGLNAILRNYINTFFNAFKIQIL